MNTPRPLQILLVEDNPGDVRLTKEALNEGSIVHELSVVGDGMAAIDFLQRRGVDRAEPLPDLILLDLNLPKLTGRDVLAQIKSHDQWKVIPVVVLTTSESQADIDATYALHVNCYVTKPLDFQPFMDVIKQIEDFWLTIVRLPQPTPAQ